MRLAPIVIALVACAREVPADAPPAATVRAVPTPSAAPLPETAFQGEGPPPSRFEPRTIGGGDATSAPRWTGRRVNLDLKNADLQEAFRLVADVGKVNIVVSGDVSGTVTLRLRDVPWDQALDVIARAKNLDVERDGNVYLVRPQAR